MQITCLIGLYLKIYCMQPMNQESVKSIVTLIGAIKMSEVMTRVDNRTMLVGRNRLELLLFYLGDKQCFGINVFKVREVIDCPPLTRTPDSHPNVKGIAHIRGQTISIVDLAAMIGKEGLDIEKRPRVLISEYNRTVQGFLVSDVERIVNMNWKDIKPPPSGVGASSFLTAVTDVDGEIVEILDVEKVLGDIIGSDDTVSSDTISQSEGSDANSDFVLIVDDSGMARKQMSRVMDQLKIPYKTLNNGKEAFDLLHSWLDDDDPTPVYKRCGLMVSDVEMPVMDGYTLTKSVKDHPDLRELHVLLHSSLSGTFNENMVKKVGADDFIAKYDPDELAKRILSHLKLENH